jgi:hypothetical protein
MGVFDTIAIGSLEGQVKLWWNELSKLGIGDAVPAVRGRFDYDIAMREGGYVHVKDLRITGWTNRPQTLVVFDKWGDRFDPSNPPGAYYLNNAST